MDEDLFLGGGMPSPLLFETGPPSPLPASWRSSSSFAPEIHLPSEFDSWAESGFTTFTPGMASLSAAIRELTGNRGSPGSSGGAGTPLLRPPYISVDSPAHGDGYCHNTLVNSPPDLPAAMDDGPENLIHANRGFAAKLSCYGARSFNGRMEYDPPRGLIQRVSSTPSLGAPGSHERNRAFPERRRNHGSSGSDHIASGLEADSNPRKRKAFSLRGGKGKELPSSQKIAGEQEHEQEPHAKRTRDSEVSKTVTADGEGKCGSPSPSPSPKAKASSEPQKDYIHVRARRGQATDSHSLAERVRREKISERMKLLQDLVPGCCKVTGKALVLDEIINYVRSLQRQVEFLSMKLASADFSMEPRGRSHGMQLPPLCDDSVHELPQDDLRSIVQMGFGGNPNQERASPAQGSIG